MPLMTKPDSKKKVSEQKSKSTRMEQLLESIDKTLSNKTLGYPPKKKKKK